MECNGTKNLCRKRASGIMVLQRRNLGWLEPSEALGQSRPYSFVSQSPLDGSTVRETGHEQCNRDKSVPKVSTASK